MSVSHIFLMRAWHLRKDYTVLVIWKSKRRPGSIYKSEELALIWELDLFEGNVEFWLKKRIEVHI